MPETIVDKRIRATFQDMKPLACFRPMVRYYQQVYATIRHLARDPKYGEPECFMRMRLEDVTALRRYIDSDLENFSIEFYLQRLEWSEECHKALEREKKDGEAEHASEARENPAFHPCVMKNGFENAWKADGYTYEHFLGDTQNIFGSIHSHLTSINAALADLYYNATELPFASFTPAGRSEILHLTSELDRMMRGLLVASHLQPQKAWQRDLVNTLLSSRADCQRFLDSIPRYYQAHRLRLIVFPIEATPESSATESTMPVACLPWSSGVYLDFLKAYESIAVHTVAVIHWSMRLYSRWYLVPRRYLRLISGIINV